MHEKLKYCYFVYFVLLLEWEVVADKMECDGSEFSIGMVSTLEECAKKCVWSSMFIYGTNDFGSNRCDETGCRCICESAAKTIGTCDQVDHKGYRLYKYKIAGNVDMSFYKQETNPWIIKSLL